MAERSITAVVAARAMALGAALAALATCVMAPAAPAATVGDRGAPDAASTAFSASPFPLRPAIVHGETHMGVRILGTLEIARGSRIDGELVTELSGLAWDDDEEVLYALSDRGVLFHLRPRFEGDVLAGLEPLAAHWLRDRGGRALAGGQADAEGLAATGERNGRTGDARLTVSFERAHRIAVFDAQGREHERLELPAPLDDPASYSSRNKSLEAVTVHPRLGVLTAPERPLRGGEDMTIVVRALEGGAWRHRLHWTLNNAIVALEALPDGSILVLERGHGMFYIPVVITLQLAREPARGDDRLDAREVAVFDTSEGWNVDNFEGLTRHRGERFFMVSDDNTKAIQRTLLVYFELVRGESR